MSHYPFNTPMSSHKVSVILPFWWQSIHWNGFLEIRLLYDLCSNFLSVFYVFYDVVENVGCILSGCAIQTYCCELVPVHVANFFCVLVGYVSAFHCMYSRHCFWFVKCGGISCCWFYCLLCVVSSDVLLACW
jgi:hypothetical protein